MSEQDLSSNVTELMAQMTRMQAELDSLKVRANTQPQSTNQAKPEVSTTRRKLLRRLAGGLVAGLVVGGIGLGSPGEVEAKISSNPSTNSQNGRVGMLVQPPGSTVTGNLGGNPYKTGLIVSSDTSFNLGVFTPTVNSAILAYTSSNGTAISGLTQTGTAIYGQSDSNYGVVGYSTSSNAVYGKTTSGIGVVGESTSNHGIYGTTASNNYSGGIAGVYGIAPSTDPNSGSAGVYGISSGGLGIGVYGKGKFGVYGLTTDGYAGTFIGPVYIGGNLEKSSGSFKIDHPLDPANKYLYHSFVESPDMMNIYNGLVTLDSQGEATVEMPDWFDALNIDFRYQLTALDSASPNLHIAQRLKERRFKIAGGQPGQEISWMVTGIRQDAYAKAHRIPVEEDKADKEKGKYLHPKLFGKPEEMSVYPRSVEAK